MNVLEKVVQEIQNAKKIIIFHHIAPDGDSLGSALALKEIIEQLDSVEIIDNVITNYAPELYNYLPDIDKMKKIDDSSLYESYDLGISLDCGSKDRLGLATELFVTAKKTISIDHHVSNTNFADINNIDTSVSATGELVFDLIKPLNVTLTKDIATNIYTAILTDTGGFKFENTKPKTLRICADLLEAGADSVQIYKNCYEIKPLAMVKLQAKVINDAVLTENNQIAYGVVKRNLLEEMDATDDYVDGITETLRQIKGVEVALVFKETLRKTTRVSLRSNRLDVCAIASYFGGGGHKLAAGCLLNKRIDESIDDIISTIVNQLQYNNFS